ncbi:MAG: hypothetical protein LBU12_08570 [Deltaproteobacteria bacterium]|jgi:hypothetical protein|nr:hypothetical protein [Deltaproteobacteria bacterium]
MSNSENYKYGDHIRVCSLLYNLHGIYVGNDEVIQYVGNAIDITSLDIFACYQSTEIIFHNFRKYSPLEAVIRAYWLLKEYKCDLKFDDSEHFCDWCIEGLFTASYCYYSPHYHLESNHEDHNDKFIENFMPFEMFFEFCRNRNDYPDEVINRMLYNPELANLFSNR